MKVKIRIPGYPEPREYHADSGTTAKEFLADVTLLMEPPGRKYLLFEGARAVEEDEPLRPGEAAIYDAVVIEVAPSELPEATPRLAAV
ncbi:MAG: hypothetical protein HYV42_02040 [Candidatus Magasanikbacteria bacterium]|nr:hypothetical protein [Candidatus Magasanikbacteria bacterium]